jgi:hypothetical protein
VVDDAELLIDDKAYEVVTVPDGHPRPLPKVEVDIKDVVEKPVELLNDPGVLALYLEHIAGLVLDRYLVRIYVKGGGKLRRVLHEGILPVPPPPRSAVGVVRAVVITQRVIDIFVIFSLEL